MSDRAALLAECDDVCTSGCHSDDCEHHGYIPGGSAALQRTPNEPSRYDWVTGEAPECDEHRHIFWPGEQTCRDGVLWRPPTDVAEATLFQPVKAASR